MQKRTSLNTSVLLISRRMNECYNSYCYEELHTHDFNVQVSRVKAETRAHRPIHQSYSSWLLSIIIRHETRSVREATSLHKQNSSAEVMVSPRMRFKPTDSNRVVCSLALQFCSMQKADFLFKHQHSMLYFTFMGRVNCSWVMQQDLLPKHTVVEVNMVMYQSTEKHLGHKSNLNLFVSLTNGEFLYLLSVPKLGGFISGRKGEVVLQNASWKGLLFYPRKLDWSVTVFNVIKMYLQNTGRPPGIKSDDGELKIAHSNTENTNEILYMLNDAAGNSAVHWS